MLAFYLVALRASTAHATFSLEAPKAKQVSYAGDLVGWGAPHKMTKKGTTWVVSFDVPDASRLEYKFIVDNNWIIDPKNPKTVDNGVGGVNSVWTGPKYKANLRYERAPKHPMKRSTVNVGGRQIILFVPSGPKPNLPLLVYGDGPNYEKYGHIQNVLENLVEAGKAKPAVIVLVPPMDRMTEYGRAWKAYGHYLLDTVLPAVRKNVPVASGKAKDVILGGSSMGGLISLRLAEEFPDKAAGGVHSQSGAFLKDVGGQGAITPAGLKKLPKGERLWFCWGTFEGDLTRCNEQAAKELKAINRPFGTKTTYEGHTWTAWRNRMAEALTYLLKP